MTDPATNTRPLLWRKVEVAAALSVTIWTIDKWCREGTFPKPVFASPRSPAMWRVRDVEAWVEQRARKRHVKAPRGGRLKVGRVLPAAEGSSNDR
jgi:predicted DNA-binding transcriptional regulator AlpA